MPLNFTFVKITVTQPPLTYLNQICYGGTYRLATTFGDVKFYFPQNARWRLAAMFSILKSQNCHNFVTALPINAMFQSSMDFSGTADLMVKLSDYENPRR